MAAIKRGGKGVRRSAAAKGRATRARAAKAHTSGFLDSLMAALPFTEEQWHKFFLVMIFAGAAALAWFIASLAGLPAMAHAQVAHLAANAGFEVRHVRVTGVERMNELRVYERALSERERPMPLVDIEGLRSELLDLAWVSDARVSTQLPDTLAVDIVERVPHAVLSKPDKLVLIDRSGVELEAITAAAAKDMLTVSGPGASKQVEELTQLLDTAPALKARVKQAEWVGNRRWNFTFDTGQMLALPEGADNSAIAFVKFAKMDGANRLLGGKAEAIDMRVTDRVFIRCPECRKEELAAMAEN